MKIVGLLFCLLLVSINARAKDLPDWVELRSKLSSYEQLVDWMKEGKFYRITRLETSEVRIDPGQLSQETKIFFDDVTSCHNRFLRSTCTPILDVEPQTLVCSFALIDRAGKNVFWKSLPQ